MFDLPKMTDAEKIIYSMRPNISFGFNGVLLCNSFLEKAFKDARTASKFSEKCAEELTKQYHVSFGGNHCKVLFDDSDVHKDANLYVGGSAYPLSVRCLTKNGVKFQLNKFVGSGRSCSMDDLKHSIAAYPCVFVFDITNFNDWKVSILEQQLLLDFMANGHLTPGGIKVNKYYDVLEWHRYEVDRIRKVA
jgi:hypothetical protein